MLFLFLLVSQKSLSIDRVLYFKINTIRVLLVILYSFSNMASTKKKVTLSNSQKYELCLYADKHKLTRTQYIDWIEKKWGVRVDKSTITQILKNTNK